jgi:hypothetical protein
MINCIRRENLREADVYDDGESSQTRMWLLLSYIVAFASLVGAVWSLFANYNPQHTNSGDMWPGVAGIIQSVLIVAAGLMFWLTRTPTNNGF